VSPTNLPYVTELKFRHVSQFPVIWRCDTVHIQNFLGNIQASAFYANIIDHHRIYGSLSDPCSFSPHRQYLHKFQQSLGLERSGGFADGPSLFSPVLCCVSLINCYFLAIQLELHTQISAFSYSNAISLSHMIVTAIGSAVMINSHKT